MRWNAHTRITLASAFIGLLFTGFSSRLIYIAVGKHDEYSTLAAEKNSTTLFPIPIDMLTLFVQNLQKRGAAG